MVPEDIAAKFRDDHGYAGRGGVVVVFDGVACGWVDSLRNAEHWRHGAVAVDEHGAKWEAVGSAAAQSGTPGADDTAIAWIGRDVCAPKRRGRPPAGGVPLTADDVKAAAARRKAAQRARAKEQGLTMVSLSLDAEVVAALEKFRQFKDETQSAVVERALKNFLRKR